ncbi:MAG: hypothetical protein PHT33_13960, partial [bacterium]|nr:hypothetical protein [bacterium]
VEGGATLIEENGYYVRQPKHDICCHLNFEHGVIKLSGEPAIIYKDGYNKPLEAAGSDGNPYNPLYSELVSAIADDRKPYPSLEEGLKDVRVILAAYQSSVECREVFFNSPEWYVK